MKVGLVGFGGSGKSVLFDALAGGRSAGGSAPGLARVATVTHGDDRRLLYLADLYRPKKVTPLAFELHDYPGLAAPGTAEGAFRAADVRDEVDGLLLVVRGFATDARYYPRAEPDPAADAADLVTELILSDLDVVTRGVERLEASVRKPTPRREEERRRLAALTRIQGHLERERPVREMELGEAEDRVLRGYRLLSAKPWFLLVSLGDESPSDDGAGLGGPFADRRAVRVKLEAELLELDEEERRGFMEDLGVARLALPGLLDELLAGLGMLRFYTVCEREAHVWEIERGATAVEAAGKIHTDLARGFIRAEVVAFEDLLAHGDMQGARAAGRVRLEGRDYEVQDGDILDVRFSV